MVVLYAMQLHSWLFGLSDATTSSDAPSLKIIVVMWCCHCNYFWLHTIELTAWFFLKKEESGGFSKSGCRGADSPGVPHPHCYTCSSSCLSFCESLPPTGSIRQLLSHSQGQLDRLNMGEALLPPKRVLPISTEWGRSGERPTCAWCSFFLLLSCKQSWRLDRILLWSLVFLKILNRCSGLLLICPANWAKKLGGCDYSCVVLFFANVNWTQDKELVGGMWKSLLPRICVVYVPEFAVCLPYQGACIKTATEKSNGNLDWLIYLHSIS